MSKRRRPAPCRHQDVVERIDAGQDPSVSWHCRRCGQDFDHDPRQATGQGPAVVGNEAEQTAAAAVELLATTLEAIGAGATEEGEAWRRVHERVAFEAAAAKDVAPLVTVLASTAARLLLEIVVATPQRRGDLSTPLSPHEEAFARESLVELLGKLRNGAAKGLREGNLRRPW